MALMDPVEGRNIIREVIKQPEKVIFGLHRPISYCVMALITPMLRDDRKGKAFSQAHVLLLDKIGRGKTATFNYISAAVKAKLGKVSGQPDTMPKEFTGDEQVDLATGIRTLFKGPLHSNIFIFDEMTRVPAKGQAPFLGGLEGAFVEMTVMNEKEKKLERKSFPLYPISNDPNDKRLYFICFAAANTIEFEGTYPPSEAFKDRFTFSFRMGLPPREDEIKIRAKNIRNKTVEEVTDLATLLDISKMVDQVELSDQAHEYIMRIIENSRPYSQDVEDYGYSLERQGTSRLIKFVNEYVAMGCSPRRNIHMEAATKAWAWMMRGDDRVANIDDVKAILPITMEHVLLLQPRSLGDDITPRSVIELLLRDTKVP